jgi:hypothetical protein
MSALEQLTPQEKEGLLYAHFCRWKDEIAAERATMRTMLYPSEHHVLEEILRPSVRSYERSLARARSWSADQEHLSCLDDRSLDL